MRKRLVSLQEAKKKENVFFVKNKEKKFKSFKSFEKSKKSSDERSERPLKKAREVRTKEDKKAFNPHKNSQKSRVKTRVKPKVYEGKSLKTRVVLIGFMGCGKSSLAPLLAKELDLMPLDSDHLIKAKIGKSINYMFENFGEEFFRNEEKKVGEFLRHSQGFVCALGGGFAGLKELKRLGLVVYLKPSFEQIAKRLKSNKNRPLNDANLRNLFNSRLSLYKKNAHITQDIRGKNIKVVVEEIVQKIKEYK